MSGVWSHARPTKDESVPAVFMVCCARSDNDPFIGIVKIMYAELPACHISGEWITVELSDGLFFKNVCVPSA